MRDQTVSKYAHRGLWSAAAACALSASLAWAADAQGPILIGQSVVGVLEPGDRRQADGSLSDFYAFDGAAGQALVIEMSSSEIDSYVGIFAEGETSPLAYNDSAGRRSRDARVSVVLPRTQRYLVVANAADPADAGAYKLIVRPAAAPEPVRPRAHEMVPGKTAAGRLTSRSGRAPDGSLYEAHRFRAKAGESYRVSLESRQFAGFLSVHRPDEDQDLGFASARDGGIAEMLFTAPQDGVFEIRANAATEGEQGRYTLRLQREGEDRAPTPRTIAYADTVRAALEIGDAKAKDNSLYDLYRFRGAQGDEVTITMRSSMFEPFLSVRAPGEGRALASAADDGYGGRDAELTFVVPQDGVYEVLANAWRGQRGDYVISIEKIGRAPGLRAESRGKSRRNPS